MKIILFAYAQGFTCSREIEWCCRHNIIFKALSYDTAPHFTTMADFICRHLSDIGAFQASRLSVVEPVSKAINASVASS